MSIIDADDDKKYVYCFKIIKVQHLTTVPKSNPMHPLSGDLPLPYVPARVTRCALVAQRHSTCMSSL